MVDHEAWLLGSHGHQTAQLLVFWCCMRRRGPLVFAPHACSLLTSSPLQPSPPDYAPSPITLHPPCLPLPQIYEISWGPSPSHFMVATEKGAVEILSFPNLEPLWTLRGHSSTAYCFSCSRNNKWVHGQSTALRTGRSLRSKARQVAPGCMEGWGESVTADSAQVRLGCGVTG